MEEEEKKEAKTGRKEIKENEKHKETRKRKKK